MGFRDIKRKFEWQGMGGFDGKGELYKRCLRAANGDPIKAEKLFKAYSSGRQNS